MINMDLSGVCLSIYGSRSSRILSHQNCSQLFSSTGPFRLSSSLRICGSLGLPSSLPSSAPSTYPAMMFSPFTNKPFKFLTTAAVKSTSIPNPPKTLLIPNSPTLQPPRINSSPAVPQNEFCKAFYHKYEVTIASSGVIILSVTECVQSGVSRGTNPTYHPKTAFSNIPLKSSSLRRIYPHLWGCRLNQKRIHGRSYTIMD